MAVVNQYTNSSNGNPNGKFYALAASAPAAFHDITNGSNAVPCEGGSPGCSASKPANSVGTMNGYSAGVGYDMATGLGSVDATALVTNWGGASPAPAIVTLSPNPMNGLAAVQNLTINGAGFVAGNGLQVTVGTTVYQGAAVNFLSSTQLVVSVNVGAASQSLPVKVTLPSGKMTNAATLTVTAPLAVPVISGLSPNPITGSNSAQTLTINGSGFAAGSALQVTVGNAVYQGPPITSVSSTQIAVNVNVGASAQSLPVVVTVPSGQTSKAALLTVNAPVTAPVTAPVIAALNPDPMAGGSAPQTLLIMGSGFTSGAGLKVTVGGNTYQGSQIASAGGTQLAVSVIAGATSQSVPVQVTNPNGLASNSAILTINAAVNTPVIASVSPNPMTGSNSAQTLTIVGSGFLPGLKLTIGGNSITSSQLKLASSTQLQVSIVTGLGAHTYAVQISNSNGAISNIVNLQVNAALAPTIASLTPNPIAHATGTQSLTVNGTNFQSGAGLKVTVGNTSYTGSQVVFVGPTQLKVTVAVPFISAGLPVQVSNPSGAVSNPVSLMAR
jgi:trimeric autotransporter adhesin